MTPPARPPLPPPDDRLASRLGRPVTLGEAAAIALARVARRIDDKSRDPDSEAAE